MAVNALLYVWYILWFNRPTQRFSELYTSDNSIGLVSEETTQDTFIYDKDPVAPMQESHYEYKTVSWS